MIKSILFVCHGNICRSPMAEYIMKNLIGDDYLIESRATSTEEIGNDMHYKTKEQLLKHDIPFNLHRAKQINLKDYVDDPWYTDDFERTYNEIYNGCIKLKEKIEKGEF